MKTPVALKKVFALLVLSAIALAPGALAQEMKVGTTLENMQAAYNGESNAHVRYLAFAKKADEEGYGQVASLFRAAARAEAIHAGNHAAVIEALGGKPTAEVQTPEVGTTADNLAAAIAGESYERDTMYPAFLDQARKEGAKKAVRSLNFAKSAEAEHAALYQQALDNLEAWKGASKVFFVCPTCGKTVTAVDFAKCAVCYTEGEEFIKVN